MEERRRDKRIPASLRLEISSLFKQDHVLVDDINAPIKVLNISKSGIGFSTTSNLPLGFYFNACIQLGDEEAKLYCVVKIIRKEQMNESEAMYGCELVGMAPVLNYIFEDYERKLLENKDN